MRWTVGCVAASMLLGATGCFPEYAVGDEPSVGSNVRRVYSQDATLKDAIQVGGGEITFEITFDYSFDMDQYEVTVKQFRDWWVGEQQSLPCNDGAESCSLDPGGKYETVMTWDPQWNEHAREEAFSLPGCSSPFTPDGTVNTWDTAKADSAFEQLPMTCVSWVQAVAYCAYEGKRLPTQAEWLFAATNGGEAARVYPWGNQPYLGDCDRATHRNDPNSTGPDGACDWPVVVGSAGDGASADGIEDLAGSVFEWNWDAPWPNSGQLPLNYAGPGTEPGTAALTQKRLRHGGAYIVPDFPGDDRMENRRVEDGRGADERYNDAGFRCVETVP